MSRVDPRPLMLMKPAIGVTSLSTSFGSLTLAQSGKVALRLTSTKPSLLIGLSPGQMPAE